MAKFLTARKKAGWGMPGLMAGTFHVAGYGLRLPFDLLKITVEQANGKKDETN